MLKITIPKTEEGWNDKLNEFITLKEDITICLEHSLVSISKWESKWQKPFLSNNKKTQEELIDYIRCMTVSQNVPNEVYYLLTDKNFKAVNEYIQSPMTATTFTDNKQNSNPHRRNEVLTSEIIYYWMITFQIPWECQKWHLNRLMTLIKVCSIKNDPKKMSKKETMANNRAINEARRNKFHTKG